MAPLPAALRSHRQARARDVRLSDDLGDRLGLVRRAPMVLQTLKPDPRNPNRSLTPRGRGGAWRRNSRVKTSIARTKPASFQSLSIGAQSFRGPAPMTLEQLRILLRLPNASM